jgi:hypothetical protein
MYNATKLNNAQWRWIRSEQRNTPVTIRLHDSAKGSPAQLNFLGRTSVPPLWGGEEK